LTRHARLLLRWQHPHIQKQKKRLLHELDDAQYHEYCREKYSIPDDVLKRCKLKPEDVKDVEGYRGKGCAKCNDTGYFGRVATIEVLTVDSEIRDMIIKGASSDQINAVAIKKGMETLFDNAFGIFKRGVTTLEEVLRVSHRE